MVFVAFQPVMEVLQSLASVFPSKGWWKRPHFNFITVHYIYLVSMTIVGSLVLFAGGMDYIDAIFFSGGAATQSGLNTIDVNLLLLYQQVVLMMWACVTTPIFINTAVVFVRLHWFEKRFKHLVKEQRALRRTRTRSQAKHETAGEAELGRVGQGVNGRSIQVLHETTKPNGMHGSNPANPELVKDFAEKMGLTNTAKNDPEEPDSSSNETRLADTAIIEDDDPSDLMANDSDIASMQRPLSRKAPGSPRLGGLASRTITFPDELPTPTGRAKADHDAPPDNREMSQHIAFVERQQKNAKQGMGTLRIPGPRDFDRGEVPQEVHHQDGLGLQRKITADSAEVDRAVKLRINTSQHSDKFNADDHPVRRGITIDEPEHRPHSSRKSGESEPSGGIVSSIMSPLRARRKQHGHTHGIGERKGTLGRSFTSISAVFNGDKDIGPMPYLSYEATIGRNSAFVGLSASQREELGGIEYRSLKTLATILICYYVGFHTLGMVVYLPWILYTQPWRSLVESDGVDPGWWGVFTPASMFNDLGLTLTPDSMISFQQATVILLLGSFLILIGNTGFPIMLRFVIWVTSKFTPRGTALWEELRFLLDHPRRCFTLLFPSRANWWLFWILILFNIIDLVFFIILDLNAPAVTDLPPGYRVLNGWFQAASTRTAGFASVNLSQLHPAIQVSYMIMMYISVLPIAISVRRTNVYEEKSLGIWGGEETADMENPSYVGQHLRRQLSFDLWYIFLGFFIICIVEGDRLASLDDPAFSMFSVLFEIVSAYGTVGLSLGYPTINASLSAEFHTLSKLVIIAMMIRGRHRGLPYALDRAILLPSEKQYEHEAEDADRRYERKGSIFAESANPFARSKTWEDGDLDVNGLPKQHTALDGIDPMSAGAGGERRPLQHEDRRASNFSTKSQPVESQALKRRKRAKSFSTFVVGGLSAGPTFSKHE